MRWAFATGAGRAGKSMLLGLTQYFTPEEVNPLGINPLREIATGLFDFERLRHTAPFRLFIATTRVRDGALVVFDDQRVSLEVLLASACLPQMFTPVEIDGEIYWDGGYAGNPALEPLIYHLRSRDLLCVLVQPLEQAQPPRSAREIRERISELGFSTTFLRELESVRRAQQYLAWTFPISWIGRRIKRLRIAIVEPGESLDAYSAKTKISPTLGFLRELRDIGRERADQWLSMQSR
jgi:NTE family protein